MTDAIDPMDAIKQTFFQECDEQLAELEGGLLAMQAGDADPETVNAVFRAVHSIKGGAGAFALDALVRFAHVFETSLDALRSERMTPEPAVLMVLLRAADALADLVRGTARGSLPDDARNGVLLEELAGLLAASALPVATGVHTPLPADISPTLDPDGMEGLSFKPVRLEIDHGVSLPRWTVRFRPHASLYAKANETALLLRELSRLTDVPPVVTIDTTALPDLSRLDPEEGYCVWEIDLIGPDTIEPLREVFDFVDIDCDLEITQRLDEGTPPVGTATVSDPPAPFDFAALLRQAALPPDNDSTPSIADTASDVPHDQAAPQRREEPSVAAAKPTIRVDLDRVDRLIDLVGELVINQAMLAQRVLEAGMTRSSDVAMGLEELEHLTREIQDSVMAIRAQPVKSVFMRLPRLAREVAAMTGKQVRLVTEGEATEVDKTVIEHLSDPLTHMIRNAIDHGVERPDIRLKAGKPAEGTVRLAALHRSGRIVIEVSDDGAGIDRARVRTSAIDKGLIAADAVLSDDEIDNLIFLPGFSTAETVSDISGRGVGMDVVRRSIQSLGGRISIASRPGNGSTFTMSLPLTLAVLDGMVVSVEGQTLIVPLTAIIETLQPKQGDIHGVGGGAMVIAIRGTYVPLLDVGISLGYRQFQTSHTSCVALLIEGEGHTRTALLVDAIQGQRQVVIKSLEANYRHVPGVAAATILGDGRVALILDIDAIASRADTTLCEVGAAYV